MEERKPLSFNWIYAVAFACAAIIFAVGVMMLRQPSESLGGGMLTGATLVAAGALAIVAIMVALAIGLSLEQARKAMGAHQEELLKTLGDRLQGISVLLNVLSEQQLISDRAKIVAYRDKDRDALRRAVREEISKQDWEAAEALVTDMETHFSYRAEAERFRAEITEKRDEVQRQHIAELLAPIDRHIKAELWGAALQEAQRLMELYPKDSQVQRLPAEIESRRQMRKQQLKESWQDAVNRHDVDGSIEILKKLDLYLTPAEADQMQETARGVFKEKREALKTRFALAVQDRKWAEAIKLGDEIMHEFPNTRIAQEVREKMETLRKRADEPEMTTA